MTFDVEKYWNLRYQHGIDLSKSGLLGVGENFNKWMYKVKEHVFLRTVKPYIKSFGHRFERKIDGCDIFRILDVGSGSGFYLDLWKKTDSLWGEITSYATIHGNEISDTCIKHLYEKYSDIVFYYIDMSICEGDAKWSLIDCMKSRFDIISCMDVLFHQTDNERYICMLKNMKHILADNGVIVFTENFVKHRIESAEHIIHRSSEEIERLFAQAGLSIVYRAPMLYFMNYPIDRSPNSIMHKIWRRISGIASISPSWSYIMGMLLYPIERLMVRFAKDSPTVEIAIARKA